MKKFTGFNWKNKDEEYVNLYDTLEQKYHVYSGAAKSLLEFSQIKKGLKILDLGTGTGILAEQLITKEPQEIHVLDISAAMLMAVKARLGGKVKIIRRDFTQDWNLKEKFDAIFSSFTFYYFIPKEDIVFENVYDHLKNKGTFVFNITSYLGEVKIKGKTENTFYQKVYERLDKFLRQHGYSQGWGGMVASSLILSTVVVEQKLKKHGFKKVDFRFAPLPLNPYEAFRFTMEGFYSKGSKPIISSTLYNLPLKTRLHLLEAFIKENKKLLSSFPKVKIIEVKAVK